jgi:23S rRNA (pseudouridine1915-N3)-methyltransferase
MPVKILSIGTKMPAWINEAYAEYAKRLPKDYALNLIEIPAQKRSNNADTEAILKKESQSILEHIKPTDFVMALDVKGQSLSTEQLAQKLQSWHDQSQSIVLIIGGPEGLAEPCLKRANYRWSLSQLTFPHPLVRVILAEQVYRAWSIITRHPYHRA